MNPLPIPREFDLQDRDRRALLKRDVRISRARYYAKNKDILNWGKCLFPEKFYLPYCPTLHEYFIRIRDLPFTNTKAPRYHAKTAVKCFLIPIFQAIHEPHDFNHYMNVQYSDAKANSVNRTIRLEFEDNLELAELYGDLIGERWNEDQFVLKNGVIFSSVGTGQSIRGFNYRNKRPDYIICDDLYNEDDINNPDSTQKKTEWFWSTLYPARAQSRKTSIHVQGTATNDQDLMSQLEKSKDCVSRTFQALPEWDGNPFAPVKPLWPELNTFESLMKDKTLMGTHIFMRELQNEPRDPTTQIIKSGWIQEYDPDELVFDLKFQYSGCVLGVDPSIGAKVENDFTAMVMYYKGRYADGKAEFFYLVSVWNEHISLDQRVNLIQRIQDMQPVGRKIDVAHIESIAGFKDFTAEVKRRTTVPVREVEKVPDKITNLENKSKFFENKKVFINKNIERKLKDTLIYQLTTNHPKYDDLRDAALLPLEMKRVDAMSYAD